MKEIKKHNIKKAIRELPVMKPPEEVWKNIWSEISGSYERNRDTLDHAITELPTFNAPENTWENIIHKSEKIESRKINMKYISGIAASILLICTVLVVLNYKRNENISISKEIDHSKAFYSIDPENNMKADQLIVQYCKSLPSSCKSPQFTELKEELESLIEREKHLRTQIKQFKNNDNMIKSHVSITMKIDEIKKEMINIIMNNQWKTSKEI